MKKFIALLTVLTTCLSLTVPTTAKASTYNNPKDFVTSTEYDTGKQLVVTLTNISKQTISMTVTPHYLDSNKQELFVFPEDIVTFEPGRTVVMAFDNPSGYKSYAVELFVSTDYYLKGTGIASNISAYITSAYSYDCGVTGSNLSGVDAKKFKVAIIYYRYGYIVEVNEIALDKLSANGSFILVDDCDAVFDKVTVNVNEAYY